MMMNSSVLCESGLYTTFVSAFVLDPFVIVLVVRVCLGLEVGVGRKSAWPRGIYACLGAR